MMCDVRFVFNDVLDCNLSCFKFEVLFFMYDVKRVTCQVCQVMCLVLCVMCDV